MYVHPPSMAKMKRDLDAFSTRPLAILGARLLERFHNAA